MPQLLSPAGRWSVLVAAAVLVAACSESTTTPSRSLSPSVSNADQWPELNSPNADRHVMHVKGWYDNPGNGPDNGNGNAHGRPGGGGGTNGISYHGGPVLQAGTKVVAIYWASSTIYPGGPAAGTTGAGSADGSNVGFFLNHLGGSPYFNINTTYTDGAGRAIVNSVQYTSYWANNTNAPSGTTSISDAQMVSMLQSGFNSTAIAYDPSTLYLIMTSGQVNLGGGFGTQYCAYHYNGNVVINGVSKTVLYAAMPYDYAYPSACTNSSGSPNNDPGADAEVNTLAHEIEETTTDLLGSAWFDMRGYENADKCAWTWGATYTSNGAKANMNLGGKDFLVQQNWVNASGGYCAKSF